MIPSFLWPLALAACLMWIDRLRDEPSSATFVSAIFGLGALTGALIVLS